MVGNLPPNPFVNFAKGCNGIPLQILKDQRSEAMGFDAR